MILKNKIRFWYDFSDGHHDQYTCTCSVCHEYPPVFTSSTISMIPNVVNITITIVSSKVLEKNCLFLFNDLRDK